MEILLGDAGLPKPQDAPTSLIFEHMENKLL
jgi:hypothetical protein